MKKVLPVILALLMMTACSTKKMLRYGMDKTQMAAFSMEPAPKNANFTIEVEDLKSNVHHQEKSQLKKIRNFFITIPFFAAYSQKFDCTPGTQSMKILPDNIQFVLQNEISKASLNASSNYKLRVKVKDMNFHFQYNNKGNIIVLVVFTIRNKKEYVQPLGISMTLEYELLKDGVVVKKGEVTKEVSEKNVISANVGLPSCPEYVKNSFYNPNSSNPANRQEYNRSTKGDYVQLNGGTMSEAISATNYGFRMFPQLISELSADIISGIKTEIK